MEGTPPYTEKRLDHEKETTPCLQSKAACEGDRDIRGDISGKGSEEGE